jgi:hypothetical protein
MERMLGGASGVTGAVSLGDASAPPVDADAVRQAQLAVCKPLTR